MEDDKFKKKEFKPLSSDYLMLRGRLLEGTFPEDSGGWGTSVLRVMFGWGLVNDEDYPYRYDEMPNDLDRLDEIAKATRIGGYRIIRDSEDAKKSIDSMYPITGSFEITDQWYHAPDGIIEDIPPDVEPTSSHTVVFLDYTRSGFLIFSNSWGREWGHDGYGMMSEVYFNEWSVGAHTTLDVHWKNDLLHLRGVIVSSRQYAAGGFDYQIFEIIDNLKDERIGWTISVQRDGYLDLEEFFVKPEYRRKGYGHNLSKIVLDYAQSVGKSVRAWIPYADCYDENHANLRRVAEWFKVRLEKAQVHWAGYEGLPGRPDRYLPSVRIPPRPRAVRDQADTTVEPRKPSDEEERLWGRKARRSRARMAREDD